MTDDDEYDVMMRTVTCISLNELWLQPHNIRDTILLHPNTAPADSRNARAAGHPKTGIKEGSMVISHAQQINRMFLHITSNRRSISHENLR